MGDLLLKKGANINQKDGHNQTPLMTAIRYNGNWVLVRWLLERNATFEETHDWVLHQFSSFITSNINTANEDFSQVLEALKVVLAHKDVKPLLSQLKDGMYSSYGGELVE